MKRITVLEVGDVLYNPKYNGFHELRAINNKTVVLSDCCNYIDDTKTTISNSEVRIKYLKKLKPVHKIHKFMQYCESVDAWRVTRDKEDKTYLFYKDKNVRRHWMD